MRENYLLQLAIEMLEETNPYKEGIQDFCYSYMEANMPNRVSLAELLKKELQDKHKSFRKQDPVERDYAVCYEAIANAMTAYFEDYKPQSYAFLQATKLKFNQWLTEIECKYKIAEPIRPEGLKVNPYDQDTAIAMLKALHPRKGVTVNDMKSQMQISNRAIQKNLKKLDPTWNSDATEGQELLFRIGGQPIEVKLDAKQPKTGKATLYRTSNTVHPLVLLENQMQVGILLKSLAHSYYSEESGVCLSIGLDIWYQLSEYSRKRVKIYFASNDENLEDFIEELENAIPGTIECGFQTERGMIERLGEESLSKAELLAYVVKGYGRRCNIVLQSANVGLVELTGYKLNCEREQNGTIIYIATGPDGKQVKFHEEDLDDIEVEI